MPIIKRETLINAPIEICFDLSRSIDLHKISTAHTNETAIDGVTKGLIRQGQFVTWKARHFGVTQKLTSKITEFDRPTYFADEMTKGAFRRFRHEHHFKRTNSGTIMTDYFDYTSPFGLLGKLADVLFLKTYMSKLLMRRNEVIKEFAESDKWIKVLG